MLRLGDAAVFDYIESVELYGLHDPSMSRIVEWYTSLEAIERELEALARGEPEWAAQLEVLPIAFPDETGDSIRAGKRAQP